MQNLVGDVSSAARILPTLDGKTLSIVRGSGPYVWDTDGKRYVDTALGFGAILLGHANKNVTQKVTEALAESPSPSWAHVREPRAARTLAEHTGQLSKVIFTNSGSEAVHLACRAARSYTGKTRIVKMAGGFDGWLDDVAFGNAGSHDAMLSAARPSTERITLARYNDFDDIDALLRTDKTIAGVLIEPMLANAGCITPREGYLRHVRDTCSREGVLLISDEVLMGFRRFPGLDCALSGVQADIATVGKVIGNGVPIGGVVGRPEIMTPFEQGRVARGGTFSGNPLACAAVMATLGQLDCLDYGILLSRGTRLRNAITQIFRNEGIDVSTSGYGSVFTIWRNKNAPTSYEEAATIADKAFSLQLHLELRRAGVLVMPSPFGRIYLSFDHDDGVIEEMLAAFQIAARALARTQR